MRTLAFALALSCAVLGAAQAAETPRVRTFLTYNIYECRGADALGHAKTNWPGRYEREIGDIARIIRTVQPDWVVLQEVLKDGVDKVDQAARIAAESGLHMAEYVGAFEHRGGQWGAAILTREKPLATRGFVVGKDGRRPVVVAEFEDHVVYGTHLGLKFGQQQEEMAVIREKAMAETKPVILCGDMNIRNTDKGFKELFEGFTWLSPEIEKTWPQVNPTWMCDYFFVTSRHADAFRKVRAWAIREPLASDHRPVALVVERKD